MHCQGETEVEHVPEKIEKKAKLKAQMCFDKKQICHIKNWINIFDGKSVK